MLVGPARAHVAGIDAVFGQGGRAVLVPGKEEVTVVVEIAEMGTCTPMRSRPATMAGTAAAAASVFTVTRTSSLPARANSATCRTVDSTSAVSVLVMDWTTTGWQEPTGTPPIQTVGVLRRAVLLTEPLSAGPSARQSVLTRPSDLVSRSQAIASTLPSALRGVRAAMISARVPAILRSRSSETMRAKRCSYSSRSSWPLSR